MSNADSSVGEIVIHDLTDESNEHDESERTQRMTDEGLGLTTSLDEARVQGNEAGDANRVRLSLTSTPPPPYPGTPPYPSPGGIPSETENDRTRRSLAPSPPSVQVIWIQESPDHHHRHSPWHAPTEQDHSDGNTMCILCVLLLCVIHCNLLALVCLLPGIAFAVKSERYRHTGSTERAVRFKRLSLCCAWLAVVGYFILLACGLIVLLVGWWTDYFTFSE